MSNPLPEGTITPPLALLEEVGISVLTNAAEPVICPNELYVRPDIVVPVVVALILNSPVPLTLKPPDVGTETAPIAELVAFTALKSEAVNALDPVINPWAL